MIGAGGAGGGGGGGVPDHRRAAFAAGKQPALQVKQQSCWARLKALVCCCCFYSVKDKDGNARSGITSVFSQTMLQIEWRRKQISDETAQAANFMSAFASNKKPDEMDSKKKVSSLGAIWKVLGWAGKWMRENYFVEYWRCLIYVFYLSLYASPTPPKRAMYLPHVHAHVLVRVYL